MKKIEAAQELERLAKLIVPLLNDKYPIPLIVEKIKEEVKGDPTELLCYSLVGYVLEVN